MTIDEVAVQIQHILNNQEQHKRVIISQLEKLLKNIGE